MNLPGLLRATEDIDLFVRDDPANVDRLKRALRRLWNDPSIDEIHASDLAGDYPTIRYGPPEGDFVIDILGRLGTAFRFDDLEAESIDVEGVSVRVATPATLYRMKKDTVRPIDKVDAAFLRDKFRLRGD